MVLEPTEIFNCVPVLGKHQKRVLATYEDVRNILTAVLPKIGAITRSDLREALRKLRIKMTSDDFQKLCTDTVSIDPHLEPSEFYRSKKSLRSRQTNFVPSQAKSSDRSTPHPSIRDQIKSKLKDPISRHWRSILLQCKELDPTGSALL